MIGKEPCPFFAFRIQHHAPGQTDVKRARRRQALSEAVSVVFSLVTQARIHVRIEGQLIEMLNIFQRVEWQILEVKLWPGQRLDLR